MIRFLAGRSGQLIHVLGQFEILLRQSTPAMGHYAQADIVPAVNQNVRVMIHGFGFHSYAIDEVHRGLEVLEPEIANNLVTIAMPSGDLRQERIDLLFT